MKWWMAFWVLAAVVLPTDRSFAADPRYPDWPCAQAKVPEVSLAAVWDGPPLDDATNKWKDNAEVSALVPRLAARRTPLDQAEKTIVQFLSASAADKTERGKLLFAGLFEKLNAERSAVMNGLERITRKQREATAKDQAKIDELSNQLVWETRIFEDRRRVIKFVCEVPTAIDQRLFGLGRIIQQEME
jgi:hypothetical protein